MAEYLNCGWIGHGHQRLLGYENDGMTVVLECGHKYALEQLLVPIFEKPDDPNDPPLPSLEPEPAAETAPIPVAVAAAAAEALPPDAAWSDVVAKAEETSGG